MEVNLEAPVRQGQICRLKNLFGDEDPSEVYILTADPSDFEDDMNLYVRL